MGSKSGRTEIPIHYSIVNNTGNNQTNRDNPISKDVPTHPLSPLVTKPATPALKLRKISLISRIGDLLFSFLIVIFVVGFWRGIWQIMDHWSEILDVDPWLSLGVGYSIPFLLYLFQEPLKIYVNPNGTMNFFIFYVISRFLLLIHAFGCVNQWRGFWVLLDLQFGINHYSALTSLILGVLFSLIFKSFVNVLAPPLFINLDEANSIHDCALRFHRKTDQKCLYFLDCVWSVLIATSLVISCWRGLWELADLYLYPEDETYSAIASLIFGFSASFLICVTQPVTYNFMTNRKGFLRLAFAGLLNLLGFFACVFCWRGIWSFCNIFLVFEGVLTSEYITASVGAIGCLLLGTISTIIVRGVSVDGEEIEGGEWPISFLTSALNPIDDSMPFPEPWLLRFFTSQEICMKKDVNAKKNITNNIPNLRNPSGINFDKFTDFRLSQIPNIDDFDELGERSLLETPKEWNLDLETRASNNV